MTISKGKLVPIQIQVKENNLFQSTILDISNLKSTIYKVPNQFWNLDYDTKMICLSFLTRTN